MPEEVFALYTHGSGVDERPEVFKETVNIREWDVSTHNRGRVVSHVPCQTKLGVERIAPLVTCS